MKNTTTEQKSLKNITTIENITIIEKTTIKKITAKITATALLFFLALFSLTTCLVAQESGQERKTGWFVGVSPIFWELFCLFFHRTHHFTEIVALEID